MSFFCGVCKETREQGCFGPRCPGIPTHYVGNEVNQRASQELQALERHLVKRGLKEEFSLTNLWLLVDQNGRA